MADGDADKKPLTFITRIQPLTAHRFTSFFEDAFRRAEHHLQLALYAEEVVIRIPQAGYNQSQPHLAQVARKAQQSGAGQFAQ